MRAVWFLPIAYLAGIHGFAYFVPYLLFVASVAGLCGWLKRVSEARRVVALPVPVSSKLEARPA
jgi:hypothetical protein